MSFWQLIDTKQNHQILTSILYHFNKEGEEIQSFFLISKNSPNLTNIIVKKSQLLYLEDIKSQGHENKKEPESRLES